MKEGIVKLLLGIIPPLLTSLWDRIFGRKKRKLKMTLELKDINNPTPSSVKIDVSIMVNADSPEEAEALVARVKDDPSKVFKTDV